MGRSDRPVKSLLEFAAICPFPTNGNLLPAFAVRPLVGGPRRRSSGSRKRLPKSRRLPARSRSLAAERGVTFLVKLSQSETSGPRGGDRDGSGGSSAFLEWGPRGVGSSHDGLRFNVTYQCEPPSAVVVQSIGSGPVQAGKQSRHSQIAADSCRSDQAGCRRGRVSPGRRDCRPVN